MWKTILEGRDRKGLVKMADRTKAEPLLDRHVEIYESMTETLIFGKNKFDRMDMAFVSKISSMNYGTHHRVILIGFQKQKTERILQNIQRILKDAYGIMLTAVWQNLIIGILPESQIDVGSIKEVYHGIEKETGELKIAVSTIKCRLEESNQGFQEAVRTYDMIDTMRKYSEKIMLYEDLGIFGLLYDLKEPTVFEAYYKGVFQELWHYDEIHETHLFETLECYFRNECDKQKTAKELFIHENTLRYRIHQIEETMDKDLKNVNVITDIVTALKVRRMMQILDNV